VISAELKKHFETTVEALSSLCISVIDKKELPYGVQLLLDDGNSSCRINLYYSLKKGFSTVQAGGDRNLLDRVLQIHAQKQEGAQEEVPYGLRAGSDEAGKGDYFGPLVVAAVACEKPVSDALVKMGAGDSKKLTAAKIRDLYEKITVMEGAKYSVCCIPPSEYNRLFSEFRQKGKNSLDILAMAHGKAFKKLFEQGVNPDAIVVDKFCEMRRLTPWLPVFSCSVDLRVRAEDTEPSVAAASIIARSVYVEELSKLSARCGVPLSPGSGAPADSAGKRLVDLRGDAILFETAKLHFANTGRITEDT
jgi:ribonuclease HIII